jgi:hypothetical protein
MSKASCCAFLIFNGSWMQKKTSGTWFKGRFVSLCIPFVLQNLFRDKAAYRSLWNFKHSTVADKGMRTSRPSCFTLKALLLRRSAGRAHSLCLLGKWDFKRTGRIKDATRPTDESPCDDHNNGRRKSGPAAEGKEAGKFAGSSRLSPDALLLNHAAPKLARFHAAGSRSLRFFHGSWGHLGVWGSWLV